MASRTVFLQGKGKWITVKVPDKFNKYGLSFYPNEKALEILRDLQSEGLLNRMKKDDDGYFMRISRPASKEIKGKVRGFEPPTLLGPDSLPLTDTLVGNGSDVTCKVDIYTYPTPTGGKGIAMRLDSIRVDNLIPYTKDDFTPEQKALVDGMEEQPEQLW